MIQDQEAFSETLEAAKTGNAEVLGQLLRDYQNYLNILASSQLDKRLRRRVNPSDIVQETMLAVHRDIGAFRGTVQAEFLAWLRQILVNVLHGTIDRHVKAEKRDIRREISIDHLNHGVDRSAARLALLIPANGPSPSADLNAAERVTEIADLLSQLKPDYREIIVLRNLHGLSFEEVAARMNRSSGAVRMLWLRAIDHFREAINSNRLQNLTSSSAE